jgi:hypothetical protein
MRYDLARRRIIARSLLGMRDVGDDTQNQYGEGGRYSRANGKKHTDKEDIRARPGAQL